uniref:Uncharacterized protein n=1 Tax=Ixodes ricinus TaxID=34613 RepID=A0A6B0U1D7_IXORI
MPCTKWCLTGQHLWSLLQCDRTRPSTVHIRVTTCPATPGSLALRARVPRPARNSQTFKMSSLVHVTKKK